MRAICDIHSSKCKVCSGDQFYMRRWPLPSVRIQYCAVAGNCCYEITHAILISIFPITSDALHAARWGCSCQWVGGKSEEYSETIPFDVQLIRDRFLHFLQPLVWKRKNKESANMKNAPLILAIQCVLNFEFSQYWFCFRCLVRLHNKLVSMILSANIRIYEYTIKYEDIHFYFYIFLI